MDVEQVKAMGERRFQWRARRSPTDWVLVFVPGARWGKWVAADGQFMGSSGLTLLNAEKRPDMVEVEK